jgi:hypothetical protein
MFVWLMQLSSVIKVWRSNKEYELSINLHKPKRQFQFTTRVVFIGCSELNENCQLHHQLKTEIDQTYTLVTRVVITVKLNIIYRLTKICFLLHKKRTRDTVGQTAVTILSTPWHSDSK